MNPPTSHPSQANDAAPIAAALLIIAPPLAALAAWNVPQLLTLADHPDGWLTAIAASTVAVTALAAAAESRDDDPARTVWPLLLAWPLTYPLYMNRRHRLASGLIGTLLLCAALGWSGWQIARGQEAAAYILRQTSGQADAYTNPAPADAAQASGEQNYQPTSDEDAQRINERLRILRQRIEAER